MSIDTRHGTFGNDAGNFIRLLPARAAQPSKSSLAQLTLEMETSPDQLSPGRDAEENMANSRRRRQLRR